MCSPLNIGWSSVRRISLQDRKRLDPAGAFTDQLEVRHPTGEQADPLTRQRFVIHNERAHLHSGAPSLMVRRNAWPWRGLAAVEGVASTLTPFRATADGSGVFQLIGSGGTSQRFYRAADPWSGFSPSQDLARSSQS